MCFAQSNDLKILYFVAYLRIHAARKDVGLNRNWKQHETKHDNQTMPRLQVGCRSWTICNMWSAAELPRHLGGDFSKIYGVWSGKDERKEGAALLRFSTIWELYRLSPTSLYMRQGRSLVWTETKVKQTGDQTWNILSPFLRFFCFQPAQERSNLLLCSLTEARLWKTVSTSRRLLERIREWT